MKDDGSGNTTFMMRFRKLILAAFLVVFFVGVLPGTLLTSKKSSGLVAVMRDTKGACHESPAYPLKHTNWSNAEWQRIPYFTTEEELKVTTSHPDGDTAKAANSAPTLLAVCVFDKELPYARHFPHAMQQLYPCWSWWRHQVQKQQSTTGTNLVVQPVLLWPGPKYPKGQYAFVKGVLQFFGDSPLRVQKVYDMPEPTPTQRVIVGRIRIQHNGFDMASPADARALSEAASEVFGLPPAVSNCAANRQQPRIHILNRQDTRHIINIDALQAAVQPLAAAGSAQVSYFEHLGFRDQVAFMMQTDIVVSPHGAQLTSLPFLPPCAAVLEIFPTGYDPEMFFGTLSAVSGVDHAYVYLGVNRTAEVAWGSRHQKARTKTRKANICPPIPHIYEAVVEMVAQWRQCCLVAEQQGVV